jgi:hypothetical protein
MTITLAGGRAVTLIVRRTKFVILEMVVIPGNGIINSPSKATKFNLIKGRFYTPSRRRCFSGLNEKEVHTIDASLGAKSRNKEKSKNLAKLNNFERN